MNIDTRNLIRKAAFVRRFRPTLQALERRVTPATFTVLNLNDTGSDSLRDCISKANALSGDDIITFKSSLVGTIPVASVLNVSDDVNIVGPGALSVALSGGNVIRIMKVSTFGVSIEGLSFVDSFAAVGDGGAIQCVDAGLTLSKCVFSNNRAKDSGRGGAISGVNTTLTISDCTLTGNSANLGGAIYIDGTPAFSSGVTITRSTISNNTATNDGGGIAGYFDYSADFEYRTISGNSAKRGGAAFGHDFTFRNCAITGNTSSQQRGGIFVDFSGSGSYIGSGRVVVINTTVSGNTAGTGAAGVSGGGIYCTTHSFLVMINSTVVGNKSTAGAFIGAGIAFSSTYTPVTPIIDPNRFIVRSSIIANNIGPSGQTNVDIYAPISQPIELDYSAVGAPSNLNYYGGNNLPFSTDVKLGPLASNGGPTKSHLPAMESPVRDKGSSSPSVTTDQRGAGFFRDNNGVADIGAVEVAPQFIVGNTQDSGVDSLRAQVIDANRTAGAQTITFNSTFSTAKTIALTSGEIAVTESVAISGKGALLTAIDGKGLGRIFNFSTASASLPISISHLKLTRGSASSGGAILLGLQNLNVSNCRFENNTATADGGAIGVVSIAAAAKINIDNTTFSSNQAVNGGAFYISNTANVAFNACTLVGNSASDAGGAIAFFNLLNSTTFTINNSTLSNNVAARFGAIFLSNNGGVAKILNSTIYQNTASLANSAGGIGQSGSFGTIDLSSSIVSANVNAIGTPDLFSPGTVMANYSAIGLPTGATITGGNNLAYGLDLKLGPLQSIGGVTDTHLPASNSPVVDQGSNSLSLTTDQRGSGFPRTIGSGVDIGAVETRALVVRNTNDSGIGSLRQTLADADALSGPDTITFDPTVFSSAKTISSASGSLSVNSAVSITGPGAPSNTTIQGKSGSPVMSTVGAPLASSIQISGLRFTGGSVGIVMEAQALTLTDCIITGQTSSGGIVANGGSGSLTLDRCLVTNNIGGGLRANGPYYAPSTIIRNTTISGNVAATGGGVFFPYSGNLLIENSTISGNKATAGNGGGILLNNQNYALTIRNCTISGNSSSASGGGIAMSVFFGTLLVQNSTITANTASTSGGGLANTTNFGTVSLTSSIVSGNTNGASPDIATAGTVIANFSAIGDSKGFTLTGANNLAFGTNLKLGTLQNNGGSTQTHALLPGSPVIDKGSNPASLANDQRGLDFARNVNGSVDIGAFEYVVAATPSKITSLKINDGSAQRSRITSLLVTFDSPVTLPGNPADAFQLLRQSDSAIIALSASQVGNAVTLTFTAGAAVDFGSLADGRYTLTALAAKINSGNFDGDGNGTAGDNYVLASAAFPNPPTNIFRLFGDENGDGTVAANDFIQFRMALGGTNPIFDFDGDGSVATSDFIQFRMRFGGSI